MHLRISRRGDLFIGHLDAGPLLPHVPAVDELFRSGARAAGRHALGVVLTGMGDDGLEGSRAIAAGGGQLITESASSCVVYGMPRCVDEAGIGARSVPLDQIAREILNHVTTR